MDSTGSRSDERSQSEERERIIERKSWTMRRDQSRMSDERSQKGSDCKKPRAVGPKCSEGKNEEGPLPFKVEGSPEAGTSSKGTKKPGDTTKKDTSSASSASGCKKPRAVGPKCAEGKNEEGPLPFEVEGAPKKVGPKTPSDDKKKDDKIATAHAPPPTPTGEAIPIRLCIIGCGPAGLCTIRRAKEANIKEIICYESNYEIGGIWKYTDEVGNDHADVEIHTSLFRSLRTNIPKELMSFPDFIFKEGFSDFCFSDHPEVHKYLTDFATFYKLWDHIQVRHQVTRVSKDGNGWKVTVKDVNKGELKDEKFDAIAVCNGHYSVPNIPVPKGIESFKENGGNHMHSHLYREPTMFEGKIMLIIGAGASSVDLALDLLSHAKAIHVSTRRKPNVKYPDSVKLKPGIKNCSGRKIIFTDGSSEEIDVILYCTGYQYRYGFLDKNAKITVVRRNFIQQLYKHIINIYEPTMGFIGLVHDTFLFPLFDVQIRWFMAHLSGKMKIPSTEEMLKSWKEDIDRAKKAGKRFNHYHSIGHYRREYLEDLSKQGGFKPLPNVVYKIFDVVHHYQSQDYLNLRKRRFTIKDDDNFEMEEDLSLDCTGTVNRKKLNH